MLRAIAGYILGGILNDSPDENMECEAREINDWLVVNMPNKPEENDFDLESETESVIEDETELSIEDEIELVIEDEIELVSEDKTKSVIDEDDILSCLPMLMSFEELQNGNPFADKQERIAEISKAPLNLIEKSIHSYIHRKIDRKHVETDSTIHLYSNVPRTTATLESDDDLSTTRSLELNLWPIRGVDEESTRLLSEYSIDELEALRSVWMRRHVVERIFPMSQQEREKQQREKQHREKQQREKQQREKQQREKHQREKNNSNLNIAYYIQTPTYVNHRRNLPTMAAKTDFFQQIEDLQPTQKAKEVAQKKLLSRSNLNRQNKNYIFCSSAKTNRRKDLQRNHSGANNNRNMNRKC